MIFGYHPTLVLPFVLLLSSCICAHHADAVGTTALSHGLELKSHSGIGEDSLHQGTRSLLFVEEARLNSIIRMRIKKGADLNQVGRLPAPILMLAADSGHLDVVNTLLAENVQIDVEGPEGYTPLIAAAAKGRDDVVEKLIEAGANINAKTDKGLSALWLASEQGYLAIVKSLLKHDADVDSVSTSNATALLMAVDSGHSEVVEALLDNGASTSIVSNSNSSPLLLAVQYTDKNKANHTKICEMLLNHNADPNTIKANGQQPVIWIAAYKKDTRVVELLLQHNADADKTDGKGTPPAVVAVRYECYGCLELIAPKADLAKAEKTAGWTPLHLAAARGDISAVNILLEASASKTLKDKNNQAPYGVIGNNNNSLTAADRSILEQKLNPDLKIESTLEGIGLKTLDPIAGNKKNAEVKSKLPWWGILLLIIGCSILVALVVFVFYKRKRSRRNTNADANIRDLIDTP